MSIIASLPYTLTNGQTADATQVMSDLNTIVNGVNTNAAAITSVQNGAYNYAADTGTVNNLIIAMSPAPAAYTDGLQGRTKAANTNTSKTVTVLFGSLGTKSVVIDAAGTLPPIGCIIAGMHYTFEYDSTQDKCILLNPSTSSGSYTSTFAGFSGTVTDTINYTIAPDGDDCYFRFGNSTGTSNATTFTMTAPSNLLPANAQVVGPIYAEDSGALATAIVAVTTTSPWSLQQTVNVSLTGGWTASGTKGINRTNQVLRFKLLS